MSDPVTKEVRERDLENILRLWEECAQDLMMYLREDHATRGDDPAVKRRFDRESETARLSLSMIPALKSTYDVETY